MNETANIFLVECTSCSTSFPVDPAKVPEGGVMARCSVCEGVFRVEVPEPVAMESLTVADLAPAPEAPPEPDLVPEIAEADSQDAEASFADVAVHEAPLTPEPVQPEVEEPRPSFGQRDPKEKARRLARVLVSDMITYNPDRHAKALAAGSLADDFDDEIKKSWAEYVDQVGEEMAESTPFFTDALNEILAGGTQMF